MQSVDWVVDVWVDAVGEWVLGSATQLVADMDGKLSIVVSACSDEMGISHRCVLPLDGYRKVRLVEAVDAATQTLFSRLVAEAMVEPISWSVMHSGRACKAKAYCIATNEITLSERGDGGAAADGTAPLDEHIQLLQCHDHAPLSWRLFEALQAELSEQRALSCSASAAERLDMDVDALLALHQAEMDREFGAIEQALNVPRAIRQPSEPRRRRRERQEQQEQQQQQRPPLAERREPNATASKGPSDFPTCDSPSLEQSGMGNTVNFATGTVAL